MISTASSQIASSLNATSTSSKRLSGLVSGLDTDTIVKQLTMGTQNKIDKQGQTKQIALWRQQSYREVTKALQEFQTKYFSSSTSSSSILSASFFNSTSIKNSSPFLNVSGSATAAKNMVVTGISQLAQQAGFSSSIKCQMKRFPVLSAPPGRRAMLRETKLPLIMTTKTMKLILTVTFLLTKVTTSAKLQPP